MSLQLDRTIRTALYLSVYYQPDDRGLTFDETLDICQKVGFYEGESRDTLNRMIRAGRRLDGPDERLCPDQGVVLVALKKLTNLDAGDIKAIDWIVEEVRLEVRKLGERSWVDEAALINRGVVAQKLTEQQLRRALVLLSMGGMALKRDAERKQVQIHGGWGGRGDKPSQHMREDRLTPDDQRLLQATCDAVRDTIARRAPGVQQSPDPLEAFAAKLDHLGWVKYKAWWIQVTSELGRTDPNANPMMCTVMAAALLEAALSFVVTHAKEKGGFEIADPDKPTQWKLDQMVQNAAHNQRIFDVRGAKSAWQLVDFRKRIHVGGLVNAEKLGKPLPTPDAKPEEAKAARHDVELVVRQILDWLEKNP